MKLIKTESASLERKKGVSFEKLMLSLALGNEDEDVVMSFAGRLARLDREINPKDRKEIEMESGGKPFKQLISKLFDAFDPDKKIAQGKGDIQDRKSDQ